MPNPWVIGHLEILIRLAVAVLLGGAIGFEREHHRHPAGFRTHIMVCMGSSLIMMLSIYGFSEFAGEANVRIDPARLATAVITGVGFLGAGTILFTGKSITGLTTAASLWVVAAIGLAVGAGFTFAAASASVIVLINLWAFHKMERRFLRRSKTRVITIRADPRELVVEQVSERLNRNAVVTRKMSVADRLPGPSGGTEVELQLQVDAPGSAEIGEMLGELKRIDGVCSVSIE